MSFTLHTGAPCIPYYLRSVEHFKLRASARKLVQSLIWVMVVEYMDRAQGATQGFLPQNLHGTHTSSAEFSGRRAKRYVAAALGLAAWHLATSVEAAYRGLTMRFSDDNVHLMQ